MDLEKLPWTFSVELFKFLDSVEIIEFLKAVEQQKNSDLRRNGRFNLLIDKT